jgi:PilZ domain-containing protein
VDETMRDGPPTEAAATPVAAADKRGEGRKAVLKRAQVVFSGAAMDCIVENMSDGGARVRFGAPVPLPEAVALRFNDGTSYPARRRWAHGEAAGLEFSGSGPAAEAERRHLAAAVQDAVAATDPAEAMHLLRQVWFFGDESLRRAAEALELAQARFVAALDPHVARRPVAPVQPGCRAG